MPTNSPNRRWNFRKCTSLECKGIVNDLLPNERCRRCGKLPFAPSDEPDVIGGERGDVTVIHAHLRESLAQAERKLAIAEQRVKDAEAAKEAFGVAYCAVDDRNATLTRQIETALAFIGFVRDQPCQPEVLGGCKPGATCPIYVGKPHGWTCLNDRDAALPEDANLGKELRSALTAGHGLCLRCRAIDTLRSIATDAQRPSGCDPTDTNVCHGCHQLTEFCQCAPATAIGKPAAPTDQRPVTDQLMDIIRLASDRGMYDAADWINHRFVEQAGRAERIERELGEPPANPVPVVIHCPKCKLQHIDVDDDTGKWATTRIHRKHLCKPEDGGCGNVWQPFDYPTVGVRSVPPCPDCSQDAGGVARLCAEHGVGHVGNPSGYAALPADQLNRNLQHDPHCCVNRGCHQVCSHLCGTEFYVGGPKYRSPAACEVATPVSAEPFSAEEAREEACRQEATAYERSCFTDLAKLRMRKIAATLRRYAELTDTINSTAIEYTVGGLYRIPDGRAEFWIDVPAARKIASRVLAVLAKRRGNEGGGE